MTPTPSHHAAQTQPAIYPLRVERDALDADAVKICRRLKEHGFEAYLVGGCTRDLLLGRRPKDFDIATSARPRQVKRLFRNSRIIGRRFKLVHVAFGRKIIEVSTFRRCPQVEGKLADGLLITRDNTFGSREEDALRRDFTFNGLFFDVFDRKVIDYTGGRRDLEDGVIRTIGDPTVRVREDPVRIVRAVKFATRLGMRIDAELYSAMARHHRDLSKSAPPRVLEEFLKLLGDGSAGSAFRLLFDLGVLDLLLPEVAGWIRSDGEKPQASERLASFTGRLSVIDSIDQGKRSLTTPIYLGTVFSGPALDALARAQEERPGGGWQDAGAVVDSVLRPFAQRFRLSRFDLSRTRAILVAQRRFQTASEAKRRRRVALRSFVTREYFAETFLLYRILSESAGRLDELADWSARVEAARMEAQEESSRGTGSPSSGGRRRRNRKKRRNRSSRRTGQG